MVARIVARNGVNPGPFDHPRRFHFDTSYGPKNSKLEVGKHDHFSIGFFVQDFKPRVSFMSDNDALRA